MHERVTACHTNVPAWRGVLCCCRAMECVWYVVWACLHDLYTSSFRFNTDWLTSRGWVVVFLVLCLLEAVKFRGVGGPVTAAVARVVGVSIIGVCVVKCCGVEVTQRRRDSVDGLIRCLSVLHPVRSVCLLQVSSCHHVYLPPLICRL